MPNAFDSANYPTSEPTEITSGDRTAWKRLDLGADYPPASYTLKYSARLDSTGTEIEVTATASGSDFLVEIPSVTTAAYTAGVYRWQAYITRNSDSQRVTLNAGTWRVITNRDAAATDPRSHAKKVLDSIEAAIEALSLSQKSYTISTGSTSRSVTRRDIPELLVLRDRYKAEYQRELAAERIAAGMSNPRRVGIRFNRV